MIKNIIKLFKKIQRRKIKRALSKIEYTFQR